MGKALGIEPDIDLEELLRIQTSNEWSIQFSPLLRGPGGEQGGTFIRTAVNWKGVTKSENESFSEYQDRLASINDGVADGLAEARQMAIDVADGTSGAWLVKRNGQMFPVPASAGSLMQEGEQPVEVVGRFSSTNEALQRMAAETGQQPRFPTVY